MNSKDRNLEMNIAVFIFIIGLFLRVFYVFHYRFDNDESQHLHVVWAWTKGLLQYRDVFDNHTPLFHILCSPILRIIGEQASALYYMRLVMIIIFLITMFCTYIIARNVFSKRVGIWSVVLISIYPAFFFCSLQYRADVLWMMFWLVGLAVMLKKQLTLLRLFLTGFLFGLAMCTSMKTILLLFSLIIAIIFSLGCYKKNPWHKLWKLAFSAFAGFLIMPIIIIVFYAVKKSLMPFFYCIIEHNILPSMGHWNEIWRIILFLILLPVVYWINKISKLNIYRSVVFLSVTMYLLSLFSFWPIATRQNFLPVYSLIAILFVPWILKLADKSKFTPVLLLASLSIFEIIAIFCFSPPWINNTKKVVEEIEEVLRLTNKDDWVIDQKGETVFRPRPCYYILETFTRERMGRGIIPDDIADNLISKHCYVATNSISRFPPNARKFLWENYISIGYMRVAGKFLDDLSKEQGVFTFNLPIPGVYKIVGEKRYAEGKLDNVLYAGARFLNAGIHEFVPDYRQQKYAIVWSKAVDRGFLPSFNNNDKKIKPEWIN